MKIKGIQIGLILLFCTLVNCSNETTNYAARIDGEYEISKQKLVEYYNDLYFERRFPDAEYKGYEEAMDEIVIRKLKQIDFVKRGLNNNQQLMSNIQRVINEELLVQYFDKEYLGQYITDEVVEDYYQGLGREVNYQQIVLYKRNSNNIESLKEKANNIREEAVNNSSFFELVKQYSEDAKSAQQDGKMPTMKWQKGTSTPTNQVIFRMPEGSIQVLESSTQLLIVKVNSINEVQLRPLEEIRPEILEALREVYSPRSFADYDRDKAALLDKKEYVWNITALEQLVEWAKIDGFYRQNKYKQIIPASLESGDNFEILTYEKGTIDLQKYLYLLNNILLVETSSNPTKDDFKEFIDEALRTELIVEKARELNLDEGILTLNTKSPVILDEYVRLYDEQFIFSKIPETNEANFQTFYENTKDSLFYQPDKVNLRVKIFETEEEAQEIVSEINEGKEFENLFSGWAVKTYIINKNGETESYLSNEPNYFGDEAFKLSQGETAGPVEFQENQETKFAVIKAHNVEQEKIRTMDEINPRILNRMFRNYYFNKFSKEVASTLRNSYKVEVNEQALIELSAAN
jgi:parvulin-like peptidyl-prolyl isomerase